ncbi:stomatin (Epb7.2)-like 2, isoform CRA_b [Rattus norvegicus]|uniref:Stomatin (Epb7.2)-like 2, isoform CRA_b n=1 Tax=Rattus norvegicus TaxID=10116 RepID=A6IJ01_RAT|nr:stomatin (Epb7.2)-like 2, isoform CRA_b [Rattus norvegicus]
MLARAARGTGALLLRGSVQASGRIPRRASSGLPRNTVILFVPQQEAWVVERMGRFHRILEPVRTSRPPSASQIVLWEWDFLGACLHF